MIRETIITVEFEMPTKECEPTDISMSYCSTHKQQMASCWQMAKGNLCSACKEWHRKDFNCQKKN
jgi:hypothetical protein